MSECTHARINDISSPLIGHSSLDSPPIPAPEDEEPALGVPSPSRLKHVCCVVPPRAGHCAHAWLLAPRRGLRAVNPKIVQKLAARGPPKDEERPDRDRDGVEK